MGRIERIILIRHAVETLGYFSEQLAEGFRKLGYPVYMVDYRELYAAVEGVQLFAREGRAALVTFNAIGLRGEEVFLDAEGVSVWERLGIWVCNVLVDHPMYYHRLLEQAPREMTVFCVDRDHVRYVQRCYPGVMVRFLPLAGNPGETEPAKGTVPYQKRRYGVVFTANYVPPETFVEKLKELGSEYERFYRGILEDLLARPAQRMEEVMERHLRDELGAVTDGELAEACYGMRWLDLYARTLLRGNLIRELAEAELPVHVFGAGWETLSCRKPECLLQESGQISSAACAHAVRNARIALNVLPWFRNGAHDRVFTGMLQGAVACTDASAYLREECRDGEEIVFFSLRETKKLPELLFGLLEDPVRAERIAARGQRLAQMRHTWDARAREIAKELADL